ncbi:endothelial cell-specific chemotaxis regulator isoform X2 [Protopterus annectens]|uniref:endothelial cell-specific chemotaxis regulator isoform X2 n=1 Tax=Protopterus annectens TaxID=7888 RepID=UPI001CF97173|nr:endothelial cell-specific chemotaxis regulator isoform X2 [Protopterus annectens]
MKMFPLNILFPLWMLCLSLEAAVEISPPTTTFTVLDEVQLSNLTSLNSSSAQESTEPQVLTIVAFGGIILIALVIIVATVLISVISLKFKCCHSKESQGTQTRGHSIVPESGPPSNVEAENITLLSMKSLECNETQDDHRMSYVPYLTMETDSKEPCLQLENTKKRI